MTNKFYNFFSLSKFESEVMFSFQYWLTKLDIKSTKDNELRIKKELWLDKWVDSVFKKAFFGLIGASPPKSQKELILSLCKIKDEKKFLLIAFECISFTPYFNIQHRESSGITKEIEFEQLAINKESWEKNLLNILKKTKIDLKKIELWKSYYLESLHALGGRSKFLNKNTFIALSAIALAVTGGFAAPAIGGLVGAIMGLSGAAATSAGLAFLGGGAIATGGLGMTGGAAFVIGGGAMLGVFGGVAGSSLLFSQNRMVLSQLAKLEASLRVLYENEPNYTDILTQSIDFLIKTLKNIRIEIEALEVSIKDSTNAESDLLKKTKSELKSLKKTESYFVKSIKRLTDLKLTASGV